MRGFIKCVDKNYNIIYVKRDDPRLLNGEVIKTIKKYITAKDKNGKIHTIFDNDIRLKTEELYPVATKHFTDCKIHGRQRIYDYKMKSRIAIPEKYKNYCTKCEEYYLSDIYEPSTEDISNCIIALNDIHFVSSNQQTPKYFKKYMPQFFKIIQNFSLDVSMNMMFSEKIYFLKNKVTDVPICALNKCNQTVELVKRPGFGFTLYCRKHMNCNYTSKMENEIYEYIKKIYAGTLEKNYRTLGKEIDIYVPLLNLGIEFNGLYWHSEKNLSNKSSHLNKYLFFKNKNINILTIWEDQWILKRDIVKSVISNYVKVINKKLDARKCVLKKLSNVDKTKFLNENHIQGNCSSSINLGLFYNEELISIMTFGKRRMILGSKNSDYKEYELLRFCSKINYNVRGAASKLFNYFVQEYTPSKIISYSNLDLGEGNLYNILKFKNIGHTGINYWWTDFQRRYHRSGFMKHKLVKEGYDKNKTEEEIMYEKGYSRIWGVGNNKWEWINKS